MSVLVAILIAVAACAFLGGLIYKIAQYAKVPAPLRIPTMPAPVTKVGVGLRLLREVALFESLFRADLLLWTLAVVFHGGLALVAVRHLRYFLDPVPAIVVALQPFGIAGGIAMVIGLLGLLGRRLFIPRIKLISGPSDYLMLVWLIGIGGTGLAITFLWHTDIMAVRSFCRGLLSGRIAALPADPILIAHLVGAAALFAVFPFSKLLHAPAVFFSPTRNQVDDARDRRHVAPWAMSFDARRGGSN